MTEMFEQEQGPSWARDNWPLSDLDDLNAGLDPTRMTVEKVAAKVKESAAGVGKSDAEIKQAADDSIRAMMLIRTYRVRGASCRRSRSARPREARIALPTLARISRLHRRRPRPPDLSRRDDGYESATVRELVECLRRNYCGKIGLEYMHINDLEERRFLQERMEGKDAAISFTPEGKVAILSKVIEGEEWEKFLARKYVGTKRFGLDGGESMVPALESVIKYGGQFGVREIVLGMAHRGRLNVLANVMGKPYRVIFSEFAGGSANPQDVGGSGDVKYHLGTSSDRTFDGIDVHLSLVPNPSHLEAVNPVVLGKARAVQTHRGDTDGSQVLPVLLHGDAAFAGQGIVAEILAFSACPATAPAAPSTSSSTTRSASPPRRNSRGRRPIRPMSRRWSRRRSSTSTATIRRRSPSSPRWRWSSASASSATS
jgi:2-oxoglutarate dehydrogenase E1 component